jgi:prepilin-type N-terminal cleavage/methylation domain-containing protein
MKRMTVTSKLPCRSAAQWKRERGFSLIELLVVIAIILVITVAAAPSMVNVVSEARMRGNMSSMATYAQRVRGDAVRSNQTKSLWNVSSNGEYFLYSANASGTAPGMTGADGMMPAGKQVVFIGTPTAASVPTILDPTTAFGSATAAINSPQISFNSRGIPCNYPSSGTNCTTGSPFVWYFIFQPPFGSNRLACLSVSPAGRIKTWYWDGAQWTN